MKTLLILAILALTLLACDALVDNFKNSLTSHIEIVENSTSNL
jgi:hypothetical protein